MDITNEIEGLIPDSLLSKGGNSGGDEDAKAEKETKAAKGELEALK